MSREKDSEGKMTIRSSDEDRGNPIMGFLATLAMVAAILLAAGVFIARTRGARSFVEDGLSRAMGGKMRVQRTRIGLPYVLVCEQVASENFGMADKTWINAQEIRIGLGYRPLWRVSVHQCTVNVPKAKRDEGSSEILGRLRDLDITDMLEISRLTERIRRNVRLEIEDGAIGWGMGEKSDGIFAKGIQFRLEPVRLPGREMYYHRLNVYTVEGPDGVRLRDFSREWLTGENSEDAVLLKPGGIRDVSLPGAPDRVDAESEPGGMDGSGTGRRLWNRREQRRMP